MDLFESVNRLLRDKHTLMEATSETFKFDSAIDIFKQIVKDHQAMYVKSLGEGKYEGQYDRKKGYILIDAQSANYAVKVYEATTDDTRKKLDKISLEKYLTLINNLRNKSLKESNDLETFFRLNDLKKLLISKEIGIEDWTDRDGTPGFTMFLKNHNGKNTQFTKPVTKEQFEELQNKLLDSVSGKIWTLGDMRNFIKSDKDLVNNVTCIEFVRRGPGEYDSEKSFFVFKNNETGKEFMLSEPLDNNELKMFLLKKTK